MIRGDASDGLPGVRGIGEKGAAIIANQFKTLDEALEAAKLEDARLTPLLCKKLVEGEDYCKIAPKLVHCALDVAIPQMSIEMPKKPESLDEIYQYKNDYGLGASIDRMISALGW
jgi:5'-3' exonuclease